MYLGRLPSLIGILGLALLFLSPNGPGPEPAAASHTVPVTVTITYVKVLGEDLEGIGRGQADLYAGFAIGTSQFDDCGTFATHTHGDTEIRPNWVCTRDITIHNDSLPGFTNVDIQIWDHDECNTPFCTDTGVFESDDDQADASPGGNRAISLSLDLSNGRWSAAGGTTGIDWPRNCAQGDDADIAVLVCFDISIWSANGDADGDGLLDGWEMNGYNANGDNVIDVDLPGMGASPYRKDLILELDCLVAATYNHCPMQAAVQDVVQAFANAPVANVDGTTGIQLHVDIGDLYGHAAGAFTNVPRTLAPANSVAGNFGNFGGGGTQIPEAGNEIINHSGAGGAVSVASLKGSMVGGVPVFDPNRALIVRYGLFGHQTNARAATNDCTSGLARGDDFIVTLGGTRAPVPPATTGTACWDTDAAGNSVGSQNQQAGTLMHEFGHTLGLPHGGGDEVNRKPNYLSVMNYAFQSCSLVAIPELSVPGGCDFSRARLADLNENSLDECAGIGAGPVNWNMDGNFSGPFLDGATCSPTTGNIQSNINRDTSADANNNGVQDGDEPHIFSTLTGFDDWSNIVYKLRANGGGSGAITESDPVTPEDIALAQQIMSALYRPAPAVDKTGPATAIPGDELTYGLEVSNLHNGQTFANGPAFGATLTDTKPDTTLQSFNLGTVEVGEEVTREVKFLVSCDTADGTVLTNTAKVEATDILGNVYSHTDSVQTTVQAPVLEMEKTATASVNAGEAITYRITYENSGGGKATSVVITDTLPLDLYYSLALDRGAGPRPDSVQSNADGTTTLTWQIGDLEGGSGAEVIEYTARPSLLFLFGETLTNSASLTFTNENGCEYEAVTTSASTTIAVALASGTPVGQGYWRTHPEEWLDETLARIQATDQRYDTDLNGALSGAEVAAMLMPGGNMDKVLEQQLIATYFNLATRRINAATELEQSSRARLIRQLGLIDVRGAAIYARETLLLPVISQNRARYSDATTVLDDVNNNRFLLP